MAAAERVSTGQHLFRTLNHYVEPAVRRGVGSPMLGPGVILLETIGRRSGVPSRVPLLGWRSGDTVTVSTVRPNSEWVKNLEHDPAAKVWISGEPRTSTATVTRTAAATIVRLETDRSAKCPRATTEAGEQPGRCIGDRAGRERVGHRNTQCIGSDEVAVARTAALDR